MAKSRAIFTKNPQKCDKFIEKPVLALQLLNFLYLLSLFVENSKILNKKL